MQVKRILLLTFLLVMTLLKPVNAQDFKIGLTVTPCGDNEILRKSLDGAASYSGDGFYAVGIICQIPLTSRLDLETGIEYGKHTIIITPNLQPGMNDTPYKSNLKLTSIPIILKMNFLKHFFINGGASLDIGSKSSNPIRNQNLIESSSFTEFTEGGCIMLSSPSPIHSQNGIGAILGIGAKYDFKFGGTIFMNPYLKCHSLVPFSSEKYHQRLLEAGIRFGITYKFSK